MPRDVRRNELTETERFRERFTRVVFRSWRSKAIAVVVGVFLLGGTSYGFSWAISLASGSNAEGLAATPLALTIVATASPTPTHLISPASSTADAVVKITNPNSFAVTITAVDLPSYNSPSWATGYSDSGLTTPMAGCTNTTSTVVWDYSTGTSGTVHTLTTPLVVGPSGNANNPLYVTFTNDVFSSALPAACEGAYFNMIPFTGIVATGGSGTPTTTPATDAWTS